MRRTWMVIASSMSVVLAMGIAAPAQADRKNRNDSSPGRVCPVDSLSIGDGWGADRGSRKHMGIDLMDERGAPIRAVENGRINRTKRQSNGALQIVLRGESGSMYYYGHMDDVLVKGGQPVKAGEVIGTMGDSGSPGAVHLHFEFWRSGGESDAVDPAELINRVCSR